MGRRLLGCIVAITCARVASAEPRPTLAVLGIEAMDHGVEGAAERLTAGLRESPKRDRYDRKGAAKPIREAITKAECKFMQPACAAAVGAALAVDFVVAGELTKRGTHQVLVLALFDVRRKQRVRSVRETAAGNADARKWARTLYARLTDAATGELVIVANAQVGEILLDGAIVGALFEGRATIGGVAPGAHQLVIRARGYKPFETDVSVDGTTKQTLLLEPAAP